MNKIRKIIKKTLKEIFDKLEMPTNYKVAKISNGFLYSFENNEINYGVEIKKVKNEKIDPIMVPDENIKIVIFNTEEKYNVNFGVLLNGKLSDDIKTNKFNTINIISFIFAIMNDFINNNNVKIITYYATKQRDKIYKYIYNKYLKDNFIFYSAKETPFYDRFLIKKELIK